MSEQEQRSLLASADTITQFAQENGIEGDVEIFLSPSGGMSFGPGFSYSNNSYIKATLKADPAKGKLLGVATSQPSR